MSVALSESSFGGQGDALSSEELNLLIDGPPAPLAPEVVTRDPGGRATLRAVRLSEALAVDGRLEERVYQEVPSVTGFLQQEPREGEPETEKTEVWVFFDGTSVYFSARLWDSHPERMIANEMRRDNRGIFNNENFGVILDTFYDRRNGFFFQTNPLGALWDGQVTDEGDTNSDWNTVWHVKSARFPEGWTVEMAIPFKSLRYRQGDTQVWGINFRRIVKWKNEWDYLTPIAAAFGRDGMQRLSAAATLVGIETPERSVNLELKPYATGEVLTDRTIDPTVENDLDSDFGFDAKYGVTKSLTFDFTYHTDFAQVEDDEAQVNLTRFDLFFPEKREFFLEGQGIFNFASPEHESLRRRRGHAHPLLQPPHRTFRRAGSAHPRRRTADRPRGSVCRGRPEYLDRRSPDRGSTGDQLLGGAGQKGRSEAKQRRLHRHLPKRESGRHRRQRCDRPRRELQLLREPERERLLREDRHRGPERRGRELPRRGRLPRRSLRVRGRASPGCAELQPRESGSCCAKTFGSPVSERASVRDPSPSNR